MACYFRVICKNKFRLSIRYTIFRDNVIPLEKYYIQPLTNNNILFTKTRKNIIIRYSFQHFSRDFSIHSLHTVLIHCLNKAHRDIFTVSLDFRTSCNAVTFDLNVNLHRINNGMKTMGLDWELLKPYVTSCREDFIFLINSQPKRAYFRHLVTPS